MDLTRIGKDSQKNQKLWYYFYAWWFFNCLRNIERQMKELHTLYEDKKNLQIKEEKQLQSVTKSLDLRETWRKHRKLKERNKSLIKRVDDLEQYSHGNCLPVSFFMMWRKHWCCGYHYCTNPFNKTWIQVLHRFKSCA